MGLEAFEAREWLDVVDIVYVCVCVCISLGRRLLDGLCV